MHMNKLSFKFNYEKRYSIHESASYQLEGGWIGDFYESLQNMEVSKTNNRNEPINMRRKVDYTKQAMVKYTMKWKHKD